MNLEVKWPNSGRYVLAISGGSDSMVLLDLFAGQTDVRGYELVVAHFDHGLRPTSNKDRQLVERVAAGHKLSFVTKEAKLGHASEAEARMARYAWLEEVRGGAGAKAVVTAHHEDDLLETSLLNLARGTGRRGLAPMRSEVVLRPLLGVPKSALKMYAKMNKIEWHDDETNTDLANSRNLLRHVLLGDSDPHWRKSYLGKMAELAILNKKIDQLLESHVAENDGAEKGYTISRFVVQSLSLSALEELLLFVARRLRPDVEPGARVTQELALFAKTGHPGSRRAIREGLWVILDRDLVRVCNGDNLY